MQDDYNPFTEAVAGPFFVGRENQVDHFRRALSGLQNGFPQHFYAAGPHGSGKTSYLVRIADLARQGGCMAAIATIDAPASAQQQVLNVMRTIVKDISETAPSTARQGYSHLIRQWDGDEESRLFRSPQLQHLQSDALREDLATIDRQLVERPGIVVGIDEAQRLEPFALSALKNAFQHLRSYLVVLSVRLDDGVADSLSAGREILETMARDAEGDIGASRFYVSGVELGPFGSDAESEQSVLRRLQGSVRSFSSQVIHDISRAAGRLPRDVIALSSAVYDEIARENEPIAEMPHFYAAFKQRYRVPYQRACSLISSLSPNEADILAALAEEASGATASTLIQAVYTTVPQNHLTAFEEAVTHVLARLAENGACSRRDQQFEITDPVFRYAVRMAHGGW